MVSLRIITKQLVPVALVALIFLLCPTWCGADGLIVIPRPPYPPHPPPPHPSPPPVDPFPLEVVYHRVSVSIDQKIATTAIEQAFYNPTGYRLEGYYLFPIPSGAVLNEFTMFINGKKTSAELLDAKKARKIYEDIVRQMKDPALLEYSNQNLFKVRIFPIEPRSKKEITISYREVLPEENGTVEYLYPLNTEKFSAQPLQDVSISVTLQASDPLQNIYCPTHNVDIVRKTETRALITYEDRKVKPDQDFRLYYSTAQSKVGLSFLAYKNAQEDGYFYLSISPKFTLKESDVTDKDITFVLDVSGSMVGDKLKQARKAMTYCIENLNDGDRFEIIRFSTEAYPLFRKLAEVTRSTKDQARHFVDQLKAVGGTNIEEALRLALAERTQTQRPHLIVFITDGKPTIGEMSEDRLVDLIKKANTSHTRIFTFGIGTEINTHLLDKITEISQATRTYVAPNEEIELKISNFYDKVQSPILTDLTLNVGRNIELYQIYPSPLPDLFRGSNLTLFGRYKSDGSSRLSLTGKIKGQQREFTVEAVFVRDNSKIDFIPPLWAARRIGHLLDLIRLHGDSKELIDEITELARTHGIVTPYTSYLIMEDERARTVRREIPTDYQTLAGSAPIEDVVLDRYRGEYKKMSAKSGENSVTASEEVQILQQATSAPNVHPGKSRLNYTDKEGRTRNLSQQFKYVHGRALYQSGKFWIDSRILSRHSKQKIRIHFGSQEYFDLLQDKPEIAEFLALGQNIRFLHLGVLYEIYD